MVYVKSQPWWEPEDGALLEPEVEWNMWTTRAWPYLHLEEGNHIFCVSGGSTSRGIVRCEAEVVHLVKGDYATKEAAWTLLANGMPSGPGSVSKKAFLRHEYTRAAPDAGWLLAFECRPIRAIGDPRPHDLRFRPNGWVDYPRDL